MDMWMKVGSALLLGAMIVMLSPRAMQMMKESKAAEAGDWPSFILPLLAVGCFVALLMAMV